MGECIYQSVKVTLKTWHCSSNEKGSFSSNPQSIRTLKTILKYISEFYLLKTIASLLSTHDWATYPGSSVEWNTVQTATRCRILQQSSFGISSAGFLPYLPCSIAFLQAQEYWLPGADLSQHRQIPKQGIFGGVVVLWGRLIFIYSGDGICHRFDLDALARSSQEVQSLEEMRREREN